MAYCTTCGNEIDEKASLCLKCGVPTSENVNVTGTSQDEVLLAVLGSVGILFLTWIIAILGAILGGILTGVFWKSRPKAAKIFGVITIIAVMWTILRIVLLMLMFMAA